MNEDSGSVDNFLDSLGPEKSNDIKTIIKIIREKYPQSKEIVKWEMIMFEINGTFLTGISVKKDLGIFVPHTGLLRKYLPKLGKVNHDRTSFRFNKLKDINLQEFERLLEEIQNRIFSRE